MRILGWMCGHTKKDKITNEHRRRKIRVASIGEKMKRSMLRWYVYVQRHPANAHGRRCKTMNEVRVNVR